MHVLELIKYARYVLRLIHTELPISVRWCIFMSTHPQVQMLGVHWCLSRPQTTLRAQDMQIAMEMHMHFKILTAALVILLVHLGTERRGQFGYQLSRVVTHQLYAMEHQELLLLI